MSSSYHFGVLRCRPLDRRFALEEGESVVVLSSVFFWDPRCDWDRVRGVLGVASELLSTFSSSDDDEGIEKISCLSSSSETLLLFCERSSLILQSPVSV